MLVNNLSGILHTFFFSIDHVHNFCNSFCQIAVWSIYIGIVILPSSLLISWSFNLFSVVKNSIFQSFQAFLASLEMSFNALVLGKICNSYPYRLISISLIQYAKKLLQWQIIIIAASISFDSFVLFLSVQVSRCEHYSNSCSDLQAI